MAADKKQDKTTEQNEEQVVDKESTDIANIEGGGETEKESKNEADSSVNKAEKELEEKESATASVKKKKKKVRRQVQKGKAYIKSTYNNTMVTLTDLHGNSLAWSSSGLLGFKGAKKATTYAANQVVLDVAEKVQKYGLNELEIFVKGVGSGREAAIRALAQKGFTLSLIKDKTPIPHNGCRPPKPRRV